MGEPLQYEIQITAAGEVRDAEGNLVVIEGEQS